MSPFRKALQRGGDCPEPSHLVDAMGYDQTDPRRQSAELHVAGCPACRTEWAIFSQFESGEVRPEERGGVAHVLEHLQASRRAAGQNRWARFWSPAWLSGAALAMALLVMSVGVATQWRARQGAAAGASGESSERSMTLEFITPLSGLSDVPKVIRWKPVKGSVSYAPEFTEVDGTRVFYTNVTSPELLVPSDVSNLLVQRRTLFLTVATFDTSGAEIARSVKIKLRLGSDK